MRCVDKWITSVSGQSPDEKRSGRHLCEHSLLCHDDLLQVQRPRWRRVRARVQLLWETHCLVSWPSCNWKCLHSLQARTKRGTRQTRDYLLLPVVNSKTRATLLWGSLILLEVKHSHEAWKTQNFDTNIHRIFASLQSCFKYSGFGKAQDFVWSEQGRKPGWQVPHAPPQGSVLQIMDQHPVQTWSTDFQLNTCRT